jgi:hypothetical protein
VQKIDRYHYYYADAAAYLELALGDFRYLVEEGFVRYGIDARGNPHNFVKVAAAERYFDKGERLKVQDVCHDDFVYLSHNVLRSFEGYKFEWTNDKKLIYISEFESFSGDLFRLYEIDSEGLIANSDTYDSYDASCAIDADGLLEGVRFTKEELDRYLNLEVYVGPEHKFEKNLENYISQKNNISFETDQSWFWYRKPPRSRAPGMFLWRAINLYYDFHGQDIEEPSAEALLEFMSDYSSLAKRHRHWRIEVHTEGKSKKYSFEPESLGGRSQHDIDSIRQSLSGLERYRKKQK